MLSCLDFFALANDTALGFFAGGPILIAVCACDFDEDAALTMRDEWMMVKNKRWCLNMQKIGHGPRGKFQLMTMMIKDEHSAGVIGTVTVS